MKRIGQLSLVLILTGVFMLSISVTSGEAYTPAPPARAYWMAHPCATEDTSVNCFWNAKLMGNRRGHSFYVRKVGKQTCVFYVAPKYARYHDFCRIRR